MGWWSQDERGNSFGRGGGSWGDGPADTLDDALATIAAEFQEVWGCPPTCGELRRGLELPSV